MPMSTADKRKQAQALKDRAMQDSAKFRDLADKNNSAAQDGDTANTLYEFAEKMASNASPDDDEFVAPLISKADGLLQRGLTVSPDPTPAPEPVNG